MAYGHEQSAEGKAPMIIAVDPTTNWMIERLSVPDTWFYEVDD